MIVSCKNLGIGVLLFGSSLLGCAHDTATTEGNDAGEGMVQGVATSGAPGLAHVDLTVPAEWTKRAVGSWVTYSAPNGVSHLAVGAVGQNDAVAQKVNEAAAAMGASNVVTIPEQDTQFGKDQLKARVSDGTCKLGAAEGRIGYALVDLGGGERVMVIHAAPREASDEDLAAGRVAASSLRRH